MENKEVTPEKLHRAPPFQKGVDPRRNLEGRPKGSYSILTTIKQKLAENPALREELAEKIISMSKRGDMNATRLLMAYLEGMPVQKQDVSVTQVAPILGGQTLPNAIEGEIVSEEPKQIG